MQHLRNHEVRGAGERGLRARCGNGAQRWLSHRWHGKAAGEVEWEVAFTGAAWREAGAARGG